MRNPPSMTSKFRQESGNDVAQDPKPRDAADVGDDEVELQIHLHERFLHSLNVDGCALDERLATAKIGPAERRSRPRARLMRNWGTRVSATRRLSQSRASDGASRWPAGDGRLGLDNRLGFEDAGRRTSARLELAP